MNRVTAILIFVMCFAGCASIPKVGVVNSLEPGITKQTFIEHLDGAQPVGSQYIDGNYVLAYQFRNDRYELFDYYFTFDQNNLLVSWKEAPKKQYPGGGVNLLIPMPLRE